MNESLLIGKGKLNLAEGRLFDSVQMNKDPFAIMDGDEKFKAWKNIFNQIGRRDLIKCQKIDTALSGLRFRFTSPRWFENRQLLV